MFSDSLNDKSPQKYIKLWTPFFLPGFEDGRGIHDWKRFSIKIVPMEEPQDLPEQPVSPFKKPQNEHINQMGDLTKF